MDNNEIDVPPFFICPISLEIMKDPVTVSTGITYDRESIETWLFSAGNTTCPVTKQPIPDNSDLTPNHTVRRLIQSWCTLNASHGIQRIPTPKPPVTKAQIAKLLHEVKTSRRKPGDCLRQLRLLASENATNKRCMEAAGVVGFLAPMVNQIGSFDYSGEVSKQIDEALGILHQLQLSETTLKSLIVDYRGFIDSLVHIMSIRNCESGTYAVTLLKSIFEVADPIHKVSLSTHQLFVQLLQVITDQISIKATKAALKLLIRLAPESRNRVKAVGAGAVPVLIELLLLQSSEKRVSEMALVVLDMLCQSAEGRAELLKHPAGLAVVSKKILRVSNVASERGVRILLSVSKYSATTSVLQEMLQVGVVAKLCLVVQVDSGDKTKEKAKEILKLHARIWKNSPCIPSNLMSSYPS